MPTVREFFLSESVGYLDRLRVVIEAGPGRPLDPSELQRLARGLRGSAQMAQVEPARAGAQVLEAAARALASGAVPWNTDSHRRLAETLQDLTALVRGGEGAMQQETRVETLRSRWEERGVRPGDATAPEPSAAEAGFREFAAREVAAIAAELEQALPVLDRTPMDREPLKGVLRRQRALAGAARLSELPAIAETTQALDDVTRLIARVNAPVSGEWLDFYRTARDVLAPAAATLQRGEPLAETPTLRRLRSLRDSLLEGGGAAPVQQAAPAPAAEPPPQPIENFVYSGDAALARALELGPVLEAALASDAEALQALEELLDLIRLARS